MISYIYWNRKQILSHNTDTIPTSYAKLLNFYAMIAVILATEIGITYFMTHILNSTDDRVRSASLGWAGGRGNLLLFWYFLLSRATLKFSWKPRVDDIMRTRVYSVTPTCVYCIRIRVCRNREAKVKTACPRCFIILKCLVVPYSRRPTVGVNSRYFLNVVATAVSVYPYNTPQVCIHCRGV